MALEKYIVKEGQNIFDVVLQNYGTLDELFSIFTNNAALTINTDLTALQEVVINTEITGNLTVKNKYITAAHVTNNADGAFVPVINQKQFMNGDPFDFMNGDPYQFD